MSKRIKFQSKIIHKVFMETNGKCFYCDCELPEDTIFYNERGSEMLRKRNWHIDHVVPISKGGDNDISNLVASCRKCNLEKGAK